MATFSSKQEKKHGLVDPIVVLVSITLIGILIVLGSLNVNMNNSVRNMLGFQSNIAANVSISTGPSFASDLQYWDANCSHGWTSNSTCDVLVSRTQSCVIGTGSAYCSEYDAYLQQFRGQ